MKRKEELLRIRPFNMANFSSGAGYMSFFALMGAIFVIPLTFFIWCGLATSVRRTCGEMDYVVLKRRANRIFLPITIGLFIVGLIISIPDIFSYFGSNHIPGLGQWLAAIWIAAFPTVGMYGVVRIVAEILNINDSFTVNKLLLGVFIGGVPLAIFGFLISALLTESGGFAIGLPVAAIILSLVIFLIVKFTKE